MKLTRNLVNVVDVLFSMSDQLEIPEKVNFLRTFIEIPSFTLTILQVVFLIRESYSLLIQRIKISTSVLTEL